MFISTAVHLPSLLDRKVELERLIDEHAQELQKINKVVEAINSLTGDTIPSLRMNWSERAVECITGHGCFIQTTEILECSIPAEDLKDEKKRRNALVSISVALNHLVAKGRVKKIIVDGTKGHFYGLMEWVNEDGSIKPAQMANLLGRYGKIHIPLKLEKLTLQQAALLES